MKEGLSLQEQHFAQGTCFGCGPKNPLGLRLRSFAAGARVEGEWTAGEHHSNGLGFLNGGILATLLDCHAAACVMRWCAEEYGEYLFDADRQQEAKHPLFVTSALQVRFRRPAPLERPVGLVGEILSIEPRRAIIRTQVFDGERLCAEAEVTWLPIRPR